MRINSLTLLFGVMVLGLGAGSSLPLNLPSVIKPAMFHPRTPRSGCTSKVSKASFGLVVVCVCGGRQLGTTEAAFAVTQEMRSCNKICFQERIGGICTPQRSSDGKRRALTRIHTRCCSRCGGRPRNIMCKAP